MKEPDWASRTCLLKVKKRERGKERRKKSRHCWQRKLRPHEVSGALHGEAVEGIQGWRVTPQPSICGGMFSRQAKS
jgi:hypothetical protein